MWVRISAVVLATAGAFLLLRTDDRSIEVSWGGEGRRSVAIVLTPPPGEELTISFGLAVSADARWVGVSPIAGFELSGAWVYGQERTDLTTVGDAGSSLTDAVDGLPLFEGLQWLVLRWEITDCAAFASGFGVISQPLELMIADGDSEATHEVDGAFIPGWGTYDPANCGA